MADTERLVIDHVGHHGDGVAIAGGGNIYVPYTLGGETVEVAPVPGHHPDRRRLLKVEAASAERIAPFCPHFGVCGGCAIQHWDAERLSRLEARARGRRRWRRPESTARSRRWSMPMARGRRRITLHARMGTHDVLKVGFAAAGSHDIIPIDRCPILDPHLDGAIEAAWAIAEPLISIGKPLDIQITATNSGLDVDVRGSGPLSTAMIARLSRIAEQHRLARLTRHGELVLMRTPPVDRDRRRAGRAAARLVPAGDGRRRGNAGRAGVRALQARQTYRRPVLRRRPLRAAACGEVADRRLRQRRRRGRGACRRPRHRRPGLKPVKAEARDLFRRPLMPQELRDYDTVVFDPPRQGAQAQVTQLAASKMPTVVAVSCNVTTFARDAKILIDGGYKIEGVTPVDQFRHTPHVELVARFRR